MDLDREDLALQVANILAAIQASSKKLELFRRGMAYGIERLVKLEKAGCHIECLMVHGQLLEHALKQVLRACKLKREVATWVNAPNPLPFVQLSEKGRAAYEENLRESEKKTLGILIGLFRQSTGELNLSKQLEKFNTFRIDVVHQAFNGLRPPEEIDIMVIEYMKHSTFEKDVNKLVDVEMKILKEMDALFPELPKPN